MPYLRDTLLVLSSEKDCPCNATGVLALEEERFGLAVLKSEDLAITTNVELALETILSAFDLPGNPMPHFVVLRDPSMVLRHLSSGRRELHTFPG